MGTRLKPGDHDCWDKAHDDEPRFALLARDPLFEGLVLLWCALRVRDTARADRIMTRLVGKAMQRTPDPNDREKALEGERVAEAGRAWLQESGGVEIGA